MAKMVLRELMDSSTFFKFKSFLTKVCLVSFPRVTSCCQFAIQAFTSLRRGSHIMLIVAQYITLHLSTIAMSFDGSAELSKCHLESMNACLMKTYAPELSHVLLQNIRCSCGLQY
jgi:hypothetical protein